MSHTVAVEGGGTHTRVAIYDPLGARMGTVSGGPSNPAAYGVQQSARVITRLIQGLMRECPVDVRRLVLGVAGAGERVTREQLARRLIQALSVDEVIVTDDLRPLLVANAPEHPAVLVIAGTGSSVLTKESSGAMRMFGGRGRILSDEGSAYDLAVAAMRAVSAMLDGIGPVTRLHDAVVSELSVHDFRAVVQWVERANKQEIAALAKVVISCADEGDDVACACVEAGATELAALVASACACIALPLERLIFYSGGQFDHNALFRAHVERMLVRFGAHSPLLAPQVIGPDAVHAFGMLARLHDAGTTRLTRSELNAPATLATTERVPTDTPPLDALTPEGLVQAMNHADTQVVDALGMATAAIAQTVECAAKTITSGGRIIYVGAGTSGRLGVLDASECVPTFGVSPEKVVGIIAGGERALRHPVEGAEDDREQGVRDLEAVGPSAKDLVIGIAASGTTPYTVAAVLHARSLGATTAFVFCNADAEPVCDFPVLLETGAEALPGSTRLKAGTATKLALNIISTGAFALSGYVYRGMMVGVLPTNVKLKRRATRMIAALAGVSEESAVQTLERADWRVPVALVMLKLGVAREEAIRVLEAENHQLRNILDHG